MSEVTQSVRVGEVGEGSQYHTVENISFLFQKITLSSTLTPITKGSVATVQSASNSDYHITFMNFLTDKGLNFHPFAFVSLH